MTNKTKLLYLCTGNSCRSQMAEAWTRHLKGDIYEVFSAGIEAHGLLDHGGWLCVADLDTEDGSFHGMGTEGVHLGFDRTDLVHHVEAAGFQALDISTVFEIRKDVEGIPRVFPIFLLVARKI